MMATAERAAVAVVDSRPGEIVQGAGGALVPRRPVPGLIRPIARPDEMLKVQEEVRDMVAGILQEGRDFGTIAGCGDKPTMLKPGAERCTMAFGCYSRFRIVEQEVDHDREVPWLKRKKKYEDGRAVGWTQERGHSLGLYRYVVECEIVHRESETVVGSCVASCSTMESKYIDRPRDSENTVLKMAEKRAHVGAVLNAFGLSEQFTQDIEENPDLYRRDGGGDSAGAREQLPDCPKCRGPMWDNRQKKAAGEMSERAPDFKCKRKKECDGAIWPGEWPPRTELDEWAEKLRSAVEAVRAMSSDEGAEAEKRAEDLLQRAGVTVDQIKALGAQVVATLRRLEAEQGIASKLEEDAHEASEAGNPPTAGGSAGSRTGTGSTTKGAATAEPKLISEAQLRRLHAIKGKHGWTDEALKRMLADEFQLAHSDEVTRDVYDAVCTKLEDPDAIKYYAADPEQDDLPF